MSSAPAGLRTVEGTILTPTGWARGSIHFSERIQALETEPTEGPGPDLPVILPGFIDLHVHGGGGADVMAGREALPTLSGIHARHGTTCLLATTVSAERTELENALEEAAAAIRRRSSGCARILGIHLEGPFISRMKLGALPDVVRPGTLEEIQALHARAPIRVLTLAPEVPGHLALIPALREMGIRPQVGHSTGSYETGVAALEAGASGFTHLFNAMSAMHHRDPGMVGAALARAEYGELIPDLLHVHPGAVLAALRAVPKLYCVTDATAGAGMPDGDYPLGPRTVTKCGCGIRLADGTLAGSTLTMDVALRNLVSIGVPLDEASRRTSTCAAQYLGLEDRGNLAPGFLADILVLSPSLDLLRVFVEGEELAPAGD